MPPDQSHGTNMTATFSRRRAVLGLSGGVAATLVTATAMRDARTESEPGHAGHHPATPGGSGEPQLREFTLTAEEFEWELMPGVPTRAWGYNGQTPGPELRVTEGDMVRITLRNALPVPTTIHWHGVHLPPAMDGPAGLNQAAVPPGETFVYEFVARPAGTRWYHSHADPQLQVPMGLYGPLIIEPTHPVAYDREHILMLGEWDSELTPDVAAGRAERGPRDRTLRGGELGADMFLVNGRAHGAIPPLDVAEGERVLLRIINAGHMAHPIHGHGHSFTLVATDGNPVPEAARWVKDTFLIGPAERVDLAFDADNPGVWMFHCHIEHHMANGMMTVIRYEGEMPTGPAAETFGETVTSTDHGAHAESDPTPATTPTPVEIASTDPIAVGNAVIVNLVDDRFDPYQVEIPAGTTVTWVNKGADWHNVASSKAGFASDRILPGESFSFTFEEPGEYKIVCRHHGLAGMTATIIVTD
jgi:FtsP/CotA-like multicopper oxidase with cupredoxin domain